MLDVTTWLRLVVAWRLLHLVGAVAGLWLAVTTEAVTGPTAIAAPVVAVVLVLLDASSLVGLLRHRSLGRSLSLVADYLTFVGAIVVLLQANRFFVGLDALGATFGRGVPFGLLAIGAWVVGGWVSNSARLERVGTIARWVSYGSIAAMLLTVGLLPGLTTFIIRSLQPLQLSLLALALLSGYIAWRTFQADVAYALRVSTVTKRTLDGLLFASPNLLGFFAFFAGPLLFSLFVSLTEWDAFGDIDFIGLRNYVEILSLNVAIAEPGQVGAQALASGYGEWFRVGNVVVGARDVLFWRSIRNIVVFTAVALPLSTIPALFLATLLNSKAPGIKVFRAIYFVPSIAGVVAVALIWRQLLNATTGWINFLISRTVALYNSLPLLPEISDPRIQWLSDPGVALFSLAIVFSWMFVGYNAVLFLAGLQSIDQTLHEAAILDGANRWQRFRHITVPELRPTTLFVVASTGILTMQLFAENVVLFPATTPIGAGPQNSTLTPVVYLWDQGFRRFAFGYASAVAWVLFVLIFVFTLIQFRRQRAKEA